MPVDLYCFPPSMPCWAVRMLAKGVGVHLNLKEVNLMEGEHLKPEFVKMNPQHTVPTIDDDGFILWESRAILGYLVDRYAKDDSLYPKDPERRGIVDQRLYFDAANLHSNFRKAYIPVLFGQKDAADEEDLATLEKTFDMLNTFLEEGEFVAGDSLTIADISIITTIAAVEIVGFDPRRWENVGPWYDRCQQLLTDFDYEEICQGGAKLLQDMIQNGLS